MEIKRKIHEFALRHTDDCEEVHEMEEMLNALLIHIVLYCNRSRDNGFSDHVGSVEVSAVPTVENKLSVSVKTVEGRGSELYEREQSQGNIENKFLRMLCECVKELKI